MGEGRRPEEEEGRGGGQRPRGREQRGGASLRGRRAEVSLGNPLPTLSALPAPTLDPAATFWKFGGNAPNFFIKYFTGHCAGCWGHSQTEPHVTPTLQRLLGKEEASSSKTGGKKRAGAAGARIREAERKEPGSPFPSAAPLTSPEPIAGPSGQEVRGPPVPVMLLRRGRGAVREAGVPGPGTWGPGN